MPENQIGRVTHYFDRIGVAVLALTDEIKVGDEIHFLGRATDFKQKVESLQIEHRNVAEAKPGQEVALRTVQKAHEHDRVLKVTEGA